MGKAVRIDDMARKMIRLAGLIPDKDIQIKYTGLRPGEKLYEELLYKEENTLPTSNPDIFHAESINTEYNTLVPDIDKLIAIAGSDDKLETVRYMKKITPEFISQHSRYEILDGKEEN